MFAGAQPSVPSVRKTVMKAAATAVVHDMAANEFNSMCLEESKNQVVIVDFWASWCGPCKLMGVLFGKLATEYEGKPIKFVKFDIDQNKQIAKDFNIAGLPAIMVFKDGKLVPELMFEGCPSDSKAKIIKLADAAL